MEYWGEGKCCCCLVGFCGSPLDIAELNRFVKDEDVFSMVTDGQKQREATDGEIEICVFMYVQVTCIYRHLSTVMCGLNFEGMCAKHMCPTVSCT
jgi:hypothetical protein